MFIDHWQSVTQTVSIFFAVRWFPQTLWRTSFADTSSIRRLCITLFWCKCSYELSCRKGHFSAPVRPCTARAAGAAAPAAPAVLAPLRALRLKCAYWSSWYDLASRQKASNCHWLQHNSQRHMSYCDESSVSRLAFWSRFQVANQWYFSPVSHISLRDLLRGLRGGLDHSVPQREARNIRTFYTIWEQNV